MLFFFLYFVIVLRAKPKPLLFSSIAILLSLFGFFSALITSSISFINCNGEILLVLETDDINKDLSGITPLGVSIYLFLKILDTVEG